VHEQSTKRYHDGAWQVVETAAEPTPTATPGSSGPGFGIVAAVLALLAAAVGAVRR